MRLRIDAPVQCLLSESASHSTSENIAMNIISVCENCRPGCLSCPTHALNHSSCGHIRPVTQLTRTEGDVHASEQLMNGVSKDQRICSKSLSTRSVLESLRFSHSTFWLVTKTNLDLLSWRHRKITLIDHEALSIREPQYQDISHQMGRCFL